ncbi:type VI secretion system baseplate subunit TssF, partial [Klebsiella variicola subsp. variicola]
MTHQPNKSCISLTFKYLGNIENIQSCLLNLFLSSIKNIADTLLLGLTQHFDYIELKHADQSYHGDNATFCFNSQIGKDYPIFPESENTAKAPQQLLEGLYLPHVHHFINLDIPMIIKQLNWEKSTQFTINIYLNKQISLTKEQCQNCFLLNCIPTVDKEKDHTVIIDFQENKSSYLLPIPNNHYLSSLSEIMLSLEPHEKERGIYCHFYSITELTSASR